MDAWRIDMRHTRDAQPLISQERLPVLRQLCPSATHKLALIIETNNWS